jgi:hypothetical protein
MRRLLTRGTARRQDETFKRTRVNRHRRDPFLAVGQFGEPFRQRRADAAGLFNGVRELGGMRGAQHDHRDRGVVGFLLGDRKTDRGVRIDQAGGFPKPGADGRRGLLLVGAAGGEAGADLRQLLGRQREAAGLRQRAHQGADLGAIAARGFEQQPLEIRRHLDIHRRR